jgi:SAM-dependent methyltransferase
LEQAERNRRENVASLLPGRIARLLDIGCGHVCSDYAYAPCAERVTALDWRIRQQPPIPPNVELVEADFLSVDLPEGAYDAIIAADVFEHVQLEHEQAFAEKCYRLLAPGGMLLVSVPHRGTFARMDPYELKPAVQRALHKLGAYSRVHNGECDIRKGHKHYKLDELAATFPRFEIDDVRRWGYFFEPLLVFASAATRYRPSFPGRDYLQQMCAVENRDYGDRAYNMAVRLRKPATA